MNIGALLALSPIVGLAEIDRRRRDVIRDLTAARDQRAGLLLADDTDDQVANCDATADRLHLVLERLEAAETQLRAQTVSGLNFGKLR